MINVWWLLFPGFPFTKSNQEIQVVGASENHSPTWFDPRLWRVSPAQDPKYLTTTIPLPSNLSKSLFLLFYLQNRSSQRRNKYKRKMAGWFGSAPETMIVTNTPAADLAFTNLAYCSGSDLHNFAVPGTKLFMALIADSFVLSLSYPFICILIFFYLIS